MKTPSNQTAFKSAPDKANYSAFINAIKSITPIEYLCWLVILLSLFKGAMEAYYG